MSGFRRNDIALAVTRRGLVLAAQGEPAAERLSELAGDFEVEFDLYYSQIKHRCVAYDRCSRKFHIVTPSYAKSKKWPVVYDFAGVPLGAGLHRLATVEAPK